MPIGWASKADDNIFYSVVNRPDGKNIDTRTPRLRERFAKMVRQNQVSEPSPCADLIISSPAEFSTKTAGKVSSSKRICSILLSRAQLMRQTVRSHSHTTQTPKNPQEEYVHAAQTINAQLCGHTRQHFSDDVTVTKERNTRGDVQANCTAGAT